MEDILFDRITGTLAARTCALTMFTRWANSHGIPPNQVTPIQEELAYMYVCMLHSESLPANRTSRFREAIAFALHMGTDDNAVALNSKRITGSALRSFDRKRFVASEGSYARRVGRVDGAHYVRRRCVLFRGSAHIWPRTLALVCEESTLNLRSI
jgi:hypothetical protein